VVIKRFILNIKQHTLFFYVLCFFSFKATAQFYNVPGDYFFSLLTEKGLAEKSSALHPGAKPYIHFFSNKYEHIVDSHKVYKYIKNDPGVETTFYQHLIRVEPANSNFRLRIDPLINFDGGRDISGKSKTKYYTNTRGYIGSGYIGKNVYFESLFAENQSFFPTYLGKNAVTTKVIPGQGRWKTFKEIGYDYAFSSGFISVQVHKNVNIQVGHGKQKIGHGYRSLLLSDNSFNYPFIRITHQWLHGRLQYSNIYAVLMNLVPASKKAALSTERLFQKKAASFQYLSFNVNKDFNIGLFQGMIWSAGDEQNKQHLDWHYFNPVIFTNLPSYKLNNKNNIVIGCDAKLKLTNTANVYGQLMADDLSNTNNSGKKWGYQLGSNYFNALGLKNLFFQAEFNYASEASYNNPKTALTDQSFTHYNQNLAYTLNYGQELVLVADYKMKRWIANVKYNYQDIPLNGKTYYFNNILNARIGYVINPAYNLNISAGYIYRNQNFYNFRTLNNETSCFYIGLRTSLYNFYYDF
jgi:hypothetical protein